MRLLLLHPIALPNSYSAALGRILRGDDVKEMLGRYSLIPEGVHACVQSLTLCSALCVVRHWISLCSQDGSHEVHTRDDGCSVNIGFQGARRLVTRRRDGVYIWVCFRLRG